MANRGRRATGAIPHVARPTGDVDGVGLDVLTAWVSTSSDGVLVVDGDLRIVYATPAFCELVGRPLGRLLGRDAVTLVPERHRQTVLTHFADIRNGRSEPLLGITFRPDGSELETEIKGTLLDHQGRRFFVLVIRDVTERQQQAGCGTGPGRRQRRHERLDRGGPRCHQRMRYRRHARSGGLGKAHR